MPWTKAVTRRAKGRGELQNANGAVSNHANCAEKPALDLLNELKRRAAEKAIDGIAGGLGRSHRDVFGDEYGMRGDALVAGHNLDRIGKQIRHEFLVTSFFWFFSYREIRWRRRQQLYHCESVTSISPQADGYRRSTEMRFSKKILECKVARLEGKRNSLVAILNRRFVYRAVQGWRILGSLRLASRHRCKRIHKKCGSK